MRMGVDNIVNQLKADEGLSLKPYRDNRGFLTIGYGRNLDSVGITMDEAELFLRDDIQTAIAQVHKTWPWAISLNEPRRGVLYNMTFQMGMSKLETFVKMVAGIRTGDFNTAAKELLDSQYAKQVPERANRLAMQLITGEWQ